MSFVFYKDWEIEWDNEWNNSWNDWSSHCSSIVSFDDSWSNRYKEEEADFEEEFSEERKKILMFHLLDDTGDDDLEDLGEQMLKKFTGDLPEEYLQQIEKKQK